MNIDKNSLPDDPAMLKQMLLDASINYKAEMEKEREKYQHLHEKFKVLQQMYYGKKSEKLTREDKDQMYLFNEAEDGAGDDETVECPDDKATITVQGYTKKKPGRKPIPADIPREEVIHDLPDEEKQCPCCSKERPVIGKEETEELEIIPAEIKVIRHVKLKYGPCTCDDFLNEEIPEVKTASMPARMIPGSIAGPGLLAHVLTSKYVDHLPFYRQSKIFKRIEADISRATMCNWAIKASEKCNVLIDLMTEEIREGPLIQMDETTVQVLKEPDKSPQSKSYMWVAVGYTDKGKRLILYQYHKNRSENIPLVFLKDYKGYLQTDGYAGYNSTGKQDGIIHVGCFAHARRYFHDALKVNKKSKIAYKGLSFIKNIYKIENDLRERKLSDIEFVKKREDAVNPVLESFHNWLISQKDAVPPESKSGKAVHYTIGEWDKLVMFLEHYLLTPDNNIVENAIRPFVLGRKNWLFSNTPRGAESSAVIYSLIESAKANGLEPYRYLRYLFEHLPGKTSCEDLRRLLPHYLDAGVVKTG